MTDPVSSRWAPPRPPAAYTKASFLSFYSGLAAMAAMVFLVVAYYFLLHRLNFDNRNRHADLRNRQFHRHPNHGLDKSIWVLIPAHKYVKKESQTQVPDEQCTVCLSVFADGEDVRQLPECKHCFHADCIDMWFYSHSNCPLCRASLEGLPRRFQALKREANFRGLSDASAMV